MRFSLLYRNCIAAWASLTARLFPRSRVAFSIAITVLLGLTLHSATGQETPPKDLPNVLEGAIEPNAFYFFDEQGNRVMFPGISLEEIDRLKKADVGYIQRVKPYTLNSVAIEGTADGRSAELSVVTKISLVGAPGRWIEIPLKMEGFHQRGPADVIGVEQYKVDTAEDGGVLLWVKSDQPREVELRMSRVVCRVQAEVGQGIRFRLPAAPTTISMNVRGNDASASVVGRGDEVVRTSSGTPGETKIDVECSGGSFLLSWRQRDGLRESDQVLEVDSRIRVVWTDPQAPASVVAELDVSNRRGGSLGPFQVVIPENAELIEPLQGSAVAQLSVRDPESGIVQVTPDDSEPLSRLKVTFEYRLPSGNYTSENPLALFPLEVPSAVRQGGEIEIRTERNFRLRWMQQPHVRTIWRATSSDPVDIRAYSFQYDRATFSLPIWLTTKQQRLRIEPEYTIRVGRDTATLEARITATGTIIEGVPLVVDAAGWQTVAVDDLETGRSIDDPISDSGEGLELELGELTASGNSSVGVLWKAVRPIESETETSNNGSEPTTNISPQPSTTSVRLGLPMINLPDDRAVIVSQGTLVIGPTTGFNLISDLENSAGLALLSNESAFEANPKPSGATPIESSEGSSRFRILNVGGLPVYRGYLSERSPEAEIDARVDLTLDGETIRIVNDWTVQPRGSLQGVLPLVIPAGISTSVDSANQDNGGTNSEAEMPRQNNWIARVAGQPAFLRDEGNGRWTLISERLASERVDLQLELVLPFAPYVAPPNAPQPPGGMEVEDAGDEHSANSNLLSLSLPRPALAGITLNRSVPVKVIAPSDVRVLLGREGIESSETEIFSAFEDSTLLVRIGTRPRKEPALQVVSRALMRTELGRSRRYDRLLASVSGGADHFRVDFSDAANKLLPISDSERIIRVWLDGKEVLDFQRTQSGLVIPLAKQATNAPQLVDIQIWRPRLSFGTAGLISPELRLPISSGKTYWDIVMANDRHLIWSSPGSSELMLWRYENLFVHRTATRTYSELLNWIGGPLPTESQAGNRYLLVTSDPASIRIYEAGRPLLWFSTGGIVLVVSTLLFYFPILRHPLLAILGAVVVGGLAWLVPDLAIIAGQLMIAALLLVAIMIGIRALLSQRPKATVLGGVPESSSVHSVAMRRSGLGSATGGDVASKKVAEPLGSGSAAGAQL